MSTVHFIAGYPEQKSTDIKHLLETKRISWFIKIAKTFFDVRIKFTLISFPK